jgi:hypothetical protein
MMGETGGVAGGEDACPADAFPVCADIIQLREFVLLRVNLMKTRTLGTGKRPRSRTSSTSKGTYLSLMNKKTEVK